MVYYPPALKILSLGPKAQKYRSRRDDKMTTMTSLLYAYLKRFIVPFIFMDSSAVNFELHLTLKW